MKIGGRPLRLGNFFRGLFPKRMFPFFTNEIRSLTSIAVPLSV